MEKEDISYAPGVPTRQPWFWLLVAILCGVFSNGRWLNPLASWLTPIFFLRYLYGQKAARGMLIGGLAMGAVHVAAWLGMTPLEIPYEIPLFFWIGVLFWIPYCIARLLTPRIRGFAATLVFPLAFVSVEFLYGSLNPFHSNGSFAYTQADFLPLVQILSVTGLAGITFLIAWTASVFHWAWEKAFDIRILRQGVILYAGVLLAVLLFGEIRLMLGWPKAEAIRVAAVSASPEAAMYIKLAEENPESGAGYYAEVLADYLARTGEMADAGAGIVIWDELAVRTPFDLEASVVQQGRDLAREKEIFLLMALRVQDPDPAEGPRRPRENKAVLIGPDGGIVFEYLKNRITPGDHEKNRGDGLLLLAETPRGLLSAAICLDMDDPALIRQAGRSGVELMLNPADNNPVDDDMQLRMAMYRAVENGFALLRSTGDGFSAAYDHHGRLLAVSGHTTADAMMLANIPVESAKTVYAFIGDLFAGVCVAGLVFMIGRSAVGGKFPGTA
jgi:apolipoprotein N-acyltransferase